MSAPRHVLFFCFLVLMGCGAAEPRWAPDEAVAQHSYVPKSSAEIRLYTVVSRQNGSGAHSALLITTPVERILFDPAGTFSLPQAPERNDVLFGMTPQVLDAYIAYHVDDAYDVVEQRLAVAPDQAHMLAKVVKEYGAVPKARCAVAVTRVLKQLPDFQSLTVTYFPNAARRQFAAQVDVRTRLVSDDQ
ncbi:MAG: hypothetical protein ACU0GG_19025 [Paracoccaceae bacterium]